jgi:hypothetical protein
MMEKYDRRLAALFADIERLADHPDARSEAIQRELESLRIRLADLEARILENQQRPADNSVPPIFYEKEQIGYAYYGTEVEALPPSILETLGTNHNTLQAPLSGRGASIGRIVIEPPQREWTKNDASFAEAVAQQVSLQIQNLRLLTAAKRARAEAESASRRFIHESWDSFLDGIRNHERIGYAYDQAEVSPIARTRPPQILLPCKYVARTAHPAQLHPRLCGCDARRAGRRSPLTWTTISN